MIVSCLRVNCHWTGRIAQIDELQTMIISARYEGKRSATECERGDVPCAIQLIKDQHAILLAVSHRGHRRWMDWVAHVENLHTVVIRACRDGIHAVADGECGDAIDPV